MLPVADLPLGGVELDYSIAGPFLQSHITIVKRIECVTGEFRKRLWEGRTRVRSVVRLLDERVAYAQGFT